jgi:hypothetical protein
VTPARWALVGAATCMTLVACGGDDDASPSVAVEDSAAGTTTAAPSSGVPSTRATTVQDAVSATAPAATTVAGDAAPGTAPGTAVTTAPASGEKWTSPDGVFAVDFPVEPSVQNLQTPLPDGTTIPVTAYLAELDGGAVIASCVVAPGGVDPDTNAVLEAARDGALENVNAVLADSETIELQGRRGLEFSGTIGQTGSILARNYVDGDQVCQVLVIGEPASIADAAPRFLDSFEFLQEAA